MLSDSLLTVLHISDFHFSQRKRREQGIVVDALIDDLRRLCIGHRKPDLIIFSGDLVHAAGVDLHDDAYDFLLDRVSKATGCSDERLFITPGNHDLTWKGLDEHATETRAWRSVLNTNGETDKLNELYETASFDHAVKAKFSEYLQLERYISADGRNRLRKLANSFVILDHIEALKVDVIIFNTAVRRLQGQPQICRIPQPARLDPRVLDRSCSA